jgi:hypothetical protein
MKAINTLIYIILSAGTSMLAYPINVKNEAWFPLFWSIVDFFFWPLALCKWFICGEINMSLIKETFSFFFN